MSRRLIGIFVLAALLGVPALAIGLPRPTGVSGTGTQESHFETLSVSATSPTGVLTTRTLASGQSYRLAVSGTWKHSVSPNSFADARWTTTDNWLTCLQLGRGLQVDTTKFGDPVSDLECNRKDHTYSIIISGRGVRENFKIFDESYSDNSGALSVVIYEQSIVKYTYQVNNTVTIPQPLQSPVATIPGVSVPGTIIPGVSVPTLGNLTLRYKSANQYCVDVQVGNSTPVELACVFDDSGLLPGRQINLGGGQVIGPTTVAPTTLSPTVVPSQIGGITIPAGSTVNLTITWVADTTKLIKAANTTGNTELWAPFSATKDRDWFLSNMNDLSASIKVVAKDPSGATLAELQNLTIPGLGQVIEAALASRAAGR